MNRKKVCGNLTGKASSKYRSSGIVFIFSTLHQPNQDKARGSHLLRSVVSIARKGWKFRVKISFGFASILVPKY